MVAAVPGGWLFLHDDLYKESSGEFRVVFQTGKRLAEQVGREVRTRMERVGQWQRETPNVV